MICDIFNSQDLDFVIHTGDITLPKTLNAFSLLKAPLKGVFGNNDQDEIDGLLRVCNKKGFQFQDKLKIRISNHNFLFAVHDPNDIGDEFYKFGNIIVHGHTHRFRDEIYKDTYIFNPGECAGMLKGRNKVGIVDTDSPKMEIISF